MPCRTASIIAVFIACAAYSAEEKTPEEFEAKILFVKIASEYQGRAYVVDPDARWAVRLQKKDGSETTYLIHSPTLKLHDSAETAPGKTFRFRETILKSDDGKSRRTLVRVMPGQERAP